MTTLLGQAFRKFISTTCAAFVTWELPREEAARTRRRAAAAKKTSKACEKASVMKQGKQPATTSKSRKRKLFNLCTYKFHALGDYTMTIRLFGTSDSYSTQVVSCIFISMSFLNELFQGELEHRRIKRFFARTNKNNHPHQIAKHERRERRLHSMKLQGAAGIDGKQQTRQSKSLPLDQDPLPYTDPAAHYHISPSTRHFVNITNWLGDNVDDPALQVNYLRFTL
jgi:hypothetical protein